MKIQKSISEMSDKELRNYRRVIRLRIERRRKVRAFSLTVIATFCMIMIGVASYGSLKSNANSGFKYYTSITVGAGESLWDIADEYIDYDFYKNKNSYIAEVQSINHLNEKGTIVAGQTLIVPYYSSEFIY